MKQGRFLIDRAADILEAARLHSASSKVYAQRVTGNCSHQHGTAAHGNGPRRCPSSTDIAGRTRSPISIAVDGSPFPTATGANPTLTIMANAWRVAEFIASGRAG